MTENSEEQEVACFSTCVLSSECSFELISIPQTRKVSWFLHSLEPWKPDLNTLSQLHTQIQISLTHFTRNLHLQTLKPLKNPPRSNLSHNPLSFSPPKTKPNFLTPLKCSYYTATTLLKPFKTFSFDSLKATLLK